jgi:glycosyltransferase involved in cell wall biosynthesis
MKPLITMIVPYYRQPKMLQKQQDTWTSYGRELWDAIQMIVVDDCSPEPAYDALREQRDNRTRYMPHIYRIDEDVPWNRGMARNLGTTVAETDWILHVDTDHVLPPNNAEYVVEFVRQIQSSDAKMHAVMAAHWYCFKRFRIGAADETRKKDKANPNAAFVEIHPHIDSYLCTKKAYWNAGGYNEDFSGVLGGGTPFLKEMEKANGAPELLDTALHVHTRHSVPDSSEHTLPRDPAAFKKRKQEIMAKRGTLRGHDPLRLPWHKVF